MGMQNERHVFDDLDRQQIALLRAEGRAPVSVLATALGVMRSTVQARLERLLNSGALLGFTVRVRGDHAVSTIRAVMMIEVVGKLASQVIRRLRGLSELHRLHTTNGKWDLVAELRTDSLEAFDSVRREVRMTDGVSNSETSLFLALV